MRPEDLKLKNCWEAYSTATIPEHAPQVQRDAMYMTFLAGCDTVLQLYKALEQHTPTNIKTGMERWRKDVEGELERLASTTRQ